MVLEHETMDSKSSSISIDDSSSPYYIHHGDSLGLILVSQLLNGENYHTWNRSMILVLTAKNKAGFIDGSLVKPVGATKAVLLAWTRSNNLVISWI
jgi:hypothetical protein